jgi:hypothetical protein
MTQIDADKPEKIGVDPRYPRSIDAFFVTNTNC